MKMYSLKIQNSRKKWRRILSRTNLLSNISRFTIPFVLFIQNRFWILRLSLEFMERKYWANLQLSKFKRVEAIKENIWKRFRNTTMIRALPTIENLFLYLTSDFPVIFEEALKPSQSNIKLSEKTSTNFVWKSHKNLSIPGHNHERFIHLWKRWPRLIFYRPSHEIFIGTFWFNRKNIDFHESLTSPVSLLISSVQQRWAISYYVHVHSSHNSSWRVYPVDLLRRKICRQKQTQLKQEGYRRFPVRVIQKHAKYSSSRSKSRECQNKKSQFFIPTFYATARAQGSCWKQF